MMRIFITIDLKAVSVKRAEFFCRQLHDLLSTELSVDLSVCLDEFRIRLLWLSIICLVLFMQL